MSRPVHVAVIVDDAALPPLRAEHGLAVWVECDGERVLFDAGQGLALAHNAAAMGIDLSGADAVVLSHGHYDHGGGLPLVLDMAPRARVYLHPGALRRRFSRRADGTCRYVGLPAAGAERLRRLGDRLVFTSGPTRIAGGVHVTGMIPRRSPFEDAGGQFYFDETCTIPDPLDDDQAAYIRAAGELVVLTGCAHAGVVNTIEHVMTLNPPARIRAVIGGMHLKSASEVRLKKTADFLEHCDAALVAPGHCTGPAAQAALLKRLGNRCRPLAAAVRFAFD